MKGLVRWGRSRRISGSNGSSRRSSSDITASAPGRVIAAGGEDLSTPAASTNDRNGAQGATSEVGRTQPYRRRSQSDPLRSFAFPRRSRSMARSTSPIVPCRASLLLESVRLFDGAAVRHGLGQSCGSICATPNRRSSLFRLKLVHIRSGHPCPIVTPSLLGQP
jgi:hypothetical protein